MPAIPVSKAIKTSPSIGTRVVRKRDEATGVIISRVISVPSVVHTGVYGKMIFSVRLDNADWNRQAGGDQVGDLGWLKSYFRLEAR